MTERRGIKKGHKWKRNSEGVYINKDGSIRRNAILPYSKYERHATMAAGHRQGSLGEDQESIML